MSKIVIEQISKYKIPERILLLSTRETIEEDEVNYMTELLSEAEMDWSWFLGAAIFHRVCGVVYINLKSNKMVPWRVKFFLQAAYEKMKRRTNLHQQEIKRISEIFEKNEVNYAFMKGAVLNTLCYNEGERISGDTDIMVNVRDLEKCGYLLGEIGYRQGKLENGRFKPATKKQIIFARLNTYETVPYIKMMEKDDLSYHMVDINFRLSNDDTVESALEMLEDTVLMENNGTRIRTMSIEKFLIFLCIHHYREATMVYKIISGGDFLLYKYMDIHMYVKKCNIDWQLFVKFCKKIHRECEVYHTLYYTELLYPNTIDKNIFDMLEVVDMRFLNQYKGKDNSNEVYEWKTSFYERCFSNGRKIEALENIKEEFERFNLINLQLED